MENSTVYKVRMRELALEKIRDKKQLTATERFALLFQYNLMKPFQSNEVPVYGWTFTFVDAWVIYRCNISNYFGRNVNGGFCLKSNDKRDKIQIVFNIRDKNKKLFTIPNIYKNNAYVSSEMIPDVWTWFPYANIFYELSTKHQRHFEEKSQMQIIRTPYLVPWLSTMATST